MLRDRFENRIRSTSRLAGIGLGLGIIGYGIWVKSLGRGSHDFLATWALGSEG